MVKKSTATVQTDAKAKKFAMLQKVCSEIQGKFGKESVNFLGNNKIEPIPRLKSGSNTIDKITGGGYPLGRIIELFGGESSGKTTACYHAIAEAQKAFPDKWCGFVDSEYGFDAGYAKAIGVQVDELVVAQPDSGTDAFAMVQSFIENGAALVVVDSVAAMVPREEVEEDDYGKSSVGTQARMMSKALRKLTAIVGKSQCVLMFTNQTREKVGVMYGNPTCVTPDTMVELKDIDSITMENLFLRVGLDYKNMDKDVTYDVSDKNIKVKSFNHKTGKNEYRKILSLVRKDDAIMHNLVSKDGSVLLKCSGAHRIFDKDKKEYFPVEQIESGVLLSNSGKDIPFFVKKTNEIVPIVDMEVEGNSNYFTNGILSHNTTSGGKALQFYASIRLKVSKIGIVEEGSGDNKEKTSIRTKFETVKNKTFPPFRVGETEIVFGKGINNEAGVLEEMIESGVIQKKGGWYAIDGTNVAQGIVNLKQYLADNPSVYEALKVKLNAETELDIAENQTVAPIDANDMTDDEIASIAENDTQSGEV